MFNKIINQIKEKKDSKIINQYMNKDVSNLEATATGEIVSERFFKKFKGKMLNENSYMFTYRSSKKLQDEFYIFKGKDGQIYLEKNIIDTNEMNPKGEYKFVIENYSLVK